MRHGIRRVDFHVGLVVILIVVGLFAQSRRYTVTHYSEGSSLIFQRTDGWTGRAELWVLSSKNRQPRPAWVQFTIEAGRAR